MLGGGKRTKKEQASGECYFLLFLPVETDKVVLRRPAVSYAISNGDGFLSRYIISDPWRTIIYDHSFRQSTLYSKSRPIVSSYSSFHSTGSRELACHLPGG